MAPTRKLVLAVLIVPLLYYLLICGAYVITPSFHDHVEPTITAQSMLVKQGKSIYTPIDSAERLFYLYGPSPYLANIVFLAIIPDPIAATKLAGILFAASSILIIYVLVLRICSPMAAAICTAYCVLSYLLFGHRSFWNRPDSAIIFSCTLACVGPFLEKKAVSVIVTSAGVALAVNAKCHAILYLLPLLALYLRRKGWQTTLLVVLCSAALTLLPFIALPSFSLSNYLKWLILALRHGFLLSYFLTNLSCSIFLLMPLLVGLHLSTAMGERALNGCADVKKYAIPVLIICVAVVAIIASKEGSGPHHLMPFAPVIALLLSLLLRNINIADLRSTATSRGQFIRVVILLTAWVLGVFIIGTQPHRKFVHFLLNDSGYKVRSDLKAIMNDYRDYSIIMGYSGNRGYKYTQFRPLLFRSSNDYFLDAPALMDMAESGLTIPDRTIDRIRSQLYDIFLIPKGEKPFAMLGWFSTRTSLFGYVLPLAFEENYTEIDQSKYFSIWMANRHLRRRSRLPNASQYVL